MAGIDASKIRRQKRWRQRFSKIQIAIWMLLVAAIVAFVNWRMERVAFARVPSDAFMAALASGEAAKAREAHFTAALKANIPDRIFDKQIVLLSRKLGHLDGHELLEHELSWNAQSCKVVYRSGFARGEAKTIFEVLREPTGKWKIDTFFVWSENWKNL